MREAQVRIGSKGAFFTHHICARVGLDGGVEIAWFIFLGKADRKAVRGEGLLAREQPFRIVLHNGITLGIIGIERTE